MSEQIEEIIELYFRAQDEFKKTEDKEYWQGRKDGLRLALSMLQPEDRHWELSNKSSYGFRDEEWLIIKKFMEDARYNISAILYDIQTQRRVHPQTKINLIQWIDKYDRLSKKELTLPVDDACDCVPGFRWKL